jgi:hypothetical protein
MKTRHKILLMLLMATSHLNILNAQTPMQNEAAAQVDSIVQLPGTKKSAWIEAGLGIGGDSYAYDLSGQVQLTDDKLISLKYDATIHDAWAFFEMPTDGADTKTIAFELGKIYRKKWAMITFSTGLSWVHVKKYHYVPLPGSCSWAIIDCLITPYKTEVSSVDAIGIPFDLKFIFAGRFAGVVVNPFVNFNYAKTYCGITTNFAIGRIKCKKILR